MNKKRKIVIIIIVILALIGVGVFAFKDKIFTNDNSTLKTNNKKENATNKNDEVNQILDEEEINELGKNYFDKIKIGYNSSTGDDGSHFLFTTENTLTYKDVSMEEKYEMIFYSLDDDAFVKDTNVKKENLKKIVDLKKFESKFKEIFGNDKKLSSNISFSAMDEALICSESDDKYIYCFDGGGGADFAGIQLFYDHAEISKENLIIYVKSYSYYWEIEEGIIVSTEKGYNDTYSFDDYTTMDVNKIKNKIGDKLDTYKVLLKNNGDNTYYWVETDLDN